MIECGWSVWKAEREIFPMIYNFNDFGRIPKSEKLLKLWLNAWILIGENSGVSSGQPVVKCTYLFLQNLESSVVGLFGKMSERSF